MSRGVLVASDQTLEWMLPWWWRHYKKHNNFPGDTDILSYMLFKEQFQINSLPEIYNWRMAKGENPNAVIIHWVADWGKDHIRQNIKNEG